MQYDEAHIREWFSFAHMDYNAATFLYETMRPKPLEIICFHCQQAIEQAIKGVLMKFGVPVEKTHDLVVLAEALKKYVDIPAKYSVIFAEISPYGVKIGYPKELQLEDYDASIALRNTKEVCNWLESVYKKVPSKTDSDE